MIIWGSTGREIEQERGEFHCPQCEGPQGYKRMRVATYFTLYFIPLFETQHHGDYIGCLRCSGQFRPEVLDYRAPSAAERIVESIRADLESGTPLQMARTKLTNNGVDAAMAEQLVEAAAGSDHQTCTACKLTFVPEVKRCSACGGALTTIMDALPAERRWPT